MDNQQHRAAILAAAWAAVAALGANAAIELLNAAIDAIRGQQWNNS